MLVETVNLLTSSSLYGPWMQLLPDGAPFFADGASSLAMSAVSAWPLPNGTVILAYCRAPDNGIAVAPHWRGPYTRLYNIAADGTKNYSLVSPMGGPYNAKDAEGPFLWRDRRGTFRMIFHGYGSDGRITDGQTAWSTDPNLLEWHWQPEPLYSSTINYTNGFSEVFTRRERPALLFDENMNPTHLYNGVQPPNESYSGPNSHSYSYVQGIRLKSDDAANDPPVVHRGTTPLRLPDAPPWPELQATPTLGYNGWLATTNGGKVHANQTLYYRIADKLVSSGLAAAGYDTLLTVCMGWVRNPLTSKLEAPHATWPDGFKKLADYVHSKGLKIGAYTDTGATGCCRPHEIGSLGHEELDVQQFADWGVDHISVRQQSLKISPAFPLVSHCLSFPCRSTTCRSTTAAIQTGRRSRCLSTQSFTMRW
jgi:hypothetical protein